MKRRFGSLALLILVACVIANVSNATQVIHRTPKQLGAQSTLVVTGTVSGVRSFWNPQRTKIFTETTITIDETYKGSAPAYVNVLQLGGVVDNVKVTVAGALHWKNGEEVLLFLEPYTGESYQVSGFSQGKFKIIYDPKTGKRLVEHPSLEGVELVDPSSGKAAAPSARPEKTPLDKFIAQTLGGPVEEGGAR
jgi:hypothetical protein